MPAASTTRSTARATKRTTKAPATRMTLAEAMQELERAGSEQTRKTYARHGAWEPMFGVSFATLQQLRKRIGVDHELAFALWDTGNLDARNLAVKIVDPARMTAADLDRWACAEAPRGSNGYVAMLAAEGPYGPAKLAAWLAGADPGARAAAWTLLGQLAMRDEGLPDAFFAEHLAEIERKIHQAPNAERMRMNLAVVSIGCRSPALRRAAGEAARRIGPVDIDHGDTECKTTDAAAAIEKAWAHSLARGFASPAAHERTRELLRLRC